MSQEKQTCLTCWKNFCKRIVAKFLLLYRSIFLATPFPVSSNLFSLINQLTPDKITGNISDQKIRQRKLNCGYPKKALKTVCPRHPPSSIGSPWKKVIRCHVQQNHNWSECLDLDIRLLGQVNSSCHTSPISTFLIRAFSILIGIFLMKA